MTMLMIEVGGSGVMEGLSLLNVSVVCFHLSSLLPPLFTSTISCFYAHFRGDPHVSRSPCLAHQHRCLFCKQPYLRTTKITKLPGTDVIFTGPTMTSRASETDTERLTRPIVIGSIDSMPGPRTSCLLSQ